MKTCPRCGYSEELVLVPDDDNGIPDWMPRPEWEAFLKVRKKIPRAPWTEDAEKFTIRKLSKLREKGYDAAELLREATMNSWRTVYEPKSNGNGGRNGNYGYEAEREQVARVTGRRS